MRTAASLRSSFFANRLRAALWSAAVLGAIALIVAVLVGFHQHRKPQGETRRAAVAAYIVRVGRIQLAMRAKVREVDNAYKAFGKHPETLASRVGQYRQATKTLADLRHRLSLVPPPPDARRMHRLLLQLAAQNVAVAGAVTGLAAYLPALARAQAPLAGGVTALQTQVRASKTAAAQADAFDAYARVTHAVSRHVASLAAPSFFHAARAAESAQLMHLSTLATGIGDALRKKQLRQAQTLVAELSRAESQSAVVRAQRAAALLYNGRLDAISKTAKQIEAERRRLEKQVPDS